MNCIKMEQFLSLPEEVQKVFIDWWEIKEGDFAYDVIDEKVIMITRINDENGSKDYWYYDAEWDDILMTGKSYKDGYLLIPLFRLDQLWDFIENITEDKVYVTNYPHQIEVGLVNKKFGVLSCKGKLQAFWDLAVTSAKYLEMVKEDE